MTIPREGELQAVGPWPRGGNNIAADGSVPNNAFRRGVNVDIYPGGNVRRRHGATLAKAISGGANKGWSDGRTALFRAGGALFRFVPGEDPIQVATGLDPESDLIYGSVNQYLYVSDGKKALLFSPYDNSVRPWGITSPYGQPTCTATNFGGLGAGKYQVAVTFGTAFGEESGTGRAAAIDVPEGGGIALSHMPVSYEAHVTKINIYVTRINGDRLLHYATLPINATTLQIGAQSLGRRLDTQFLEALPPATGGFAFVNGRVFVANGNAVFWSRGLQFGLYDARYDYTMYPYEVNMMIGAAPGALASGVFLGSGDKTYFLGGTRPEDFSSTLKHHAGAIRGTQTFVPGSAFKDQTIPELELPIWASAAGSMCIGLPDGSVKALSDGRYAMQVGSRGSSIFRELQGVRQILTTIEPPTERLNIVAQDTLEITVVKGKTRVK